MSDEMTEQEPGRSLKNSLIIIGGVLLVILVLLVPLPALLLDILWALNFILLFLTFFVSPHTKKVNVFSFLPSYLLILTVFGLLVQISFTRLILIKGEAFDGRIIRTLSSLMMPSGGIGRLITGTLIFIIFTSIIAILSAKACVRISEIAARFTLDAFPIRLMKIDTELSSLEITDKEAIAKKDTLKHELDFYGAMDGAGKFISRNLGLNLLITAVSIIGGIAIGTLQKGETIYNTMMAYIPLTICNGFLAQFLCLMESIISDTIVIRRVSSN